MKDQRDTNRFHANIAKLREGLGNPYAELETINQPIHQNNMQESLKVKIKRLHPDAVIPKYAKAGDAGLDLVATSVTYADDTKKPYSELGTGISVEIPEGYVGLIFPRSSISKTIHSLCNAVGVIDSGYRGEITFRFNYTGTAAFIQIHRMQNNLSEAQYREVYPKGEEAYKIGDKIGQLIILPYPQVTFEEVEELTETERGANGYGHTGK